MSDSTRRLPARPSLEQLRKQAKELLKDYSTGAATERVTLADAQFALAREYGFENWAALVHHVTAIQMAESRLERYEKLAIDLVDAYQGDAEALERVSGLYSRSFTLD